MFIHKNMPKHRQHKIRSTNSNKHIIFKKNKWAHKRANPNQRNQKTNKQNCNQKRKNKQGIGRMDRPSAK
jgi:hypothetical protein